MIRPLVILAAIAAGGECVVVRRDVYERLAQYSDTSPADEELVRLGWESGKAIGWNTPEMAEYDDYDRNRP